MPEDLKLLQTGSSQLPPPFRGLHSPGVRKHCQIIFACYFRKSSITCSGPGQVNFQFSDGATIPNVTCPQVVDSGKTPRYWELAAK